MYKLIVTLVSRTVIVYKLIFTLGAGLVIEINLVILVSRTGYCI